jgi:thiol:disulfide interchange protein
VVRLKIGILLLAAFCAGAQTQQHVAWTLTLDSAAAPPGGKVLARVVGRIDPGWHLYSGSTAAGIPTSFQAAPETVIESTRLFQPQPKRAFDKNFGIDTETFEGEVTLLLEMQVQKDAPPGPAQITFKARYQTCNDSQCVPGKWTGTAALNIDPSAATAAAIPAGFSEAKAPPPGSVPAQSSPAESQGLGAFLAVAFGFGLASIFTPCVFPMIPITMSYFLNRKSGGRRDGVVQAVVFCLGIIVLFSGIGLALTAALGPFGVVQLGSNPWVNAFIAALFIAFGLSLLGAFEITVPSSILTRLNQSSEKGGFGGTLLMGLTFSLASFACVGPFVGTLLAASVGGGGARPALGMLTFASGLALPFFFLALFPSYLKRLPKSGGWMSRVKVVLGFVILAASLKYLASLDQVMQWGLLTRERFLAAWVVLFAMAGLYLLGFVRLEGIKPDQQMGIWRLLIGMAFLVFALSLIPGMFGGRLGDLDAFVPVADQATAGLGGGSGSSSTALVWMKNQYREALDRARREGKLVFVNFTGYACANCHWMKANMFTRPEIAAALQNFVLVDLYADGTDQASEENQRLELEKFQTIAEPYYAIMDPDENVIATFDGLTKDAPKYLAFLQKGLDRVVPPAAAPVSASAAPAPAAAPAAATPSSAPGAASYPQVSRVDGTPLDTAVLDGKVVVMNFWATWCVPCIQEIPSFNKLHRELAAKGVAVVGVSMDEDATRLAPFLKKHPMDYTVAVAPDSLRQQYGEALPVTLVFDRKGKQVKRFDGFTSEADLQAAIRQVF